MSRHGTLRPPHPFRERARLHPTSRHSTRHRDAVSAQVFLFCIQLTAFLQALPPRLLNAVTTVAYDFDDNSPNAFIAMFRRSPGAPPGRCLRVGGDLL